VAIAALAATFWLLVATVRLMVYPPGPPLQVAPVPAAASPARRVAKEYLDDYQDNDIEARAASSGNPMSRVALVRGFDEMRPRVAACYQTHQVPGTAMVNVVIAKSGRVSSVRVTGKFAGTPTGECVVRAVKTARFPESDGFIAPYPFQLR